MKLLPSMQTGPARTKVFGFTLGEMMITVGVFAIVVLAMVSLQLFGLRTYTLAATKLSATAGGRKALNQIRDQIRQANALYIGNCSSAGGSTFALISGNNSAQGNALQILSTTNGVPYTIFYLNTNNAPTNALTEYDVSVNAGTTNISTQVLANYITNQVVFYAQDYQGNSVTNNRNNRVIYMVLQFSQWEYPIAYVSTNQAANAYSYYQLRTRVTRRALPLN